MRDVKQNDREHLLLRVAQDITQALVHHEMPAIRPRQQDSYGGHFKYTAETFFARSQRVLSLLSVRYIAKGPPHPYKLSIHNGTVRIVQIVPPGAVLQDLRAFAVNDVVSALNHIGKQFVQTAGSRAKQICQSASNHLLSAFSAIGCSAHIIAFCEDTVIQALYLLRQRQIRRNGRVIFVAE